MADSCRSNSYMVFADFQSGEDTRAQKSAGVLKLRSLSLKIQLPASRSHSPEISARKVQRGKQSSGAKENHRHHG